MADEAPRGLGLTAKLLLVTVALVVASFGAVYFIATDTSRAGLVDLADDNLALSTQNLARAIESTMADTRADAKATARLDLAAEPMDSGDPKNFDWYADELTRSKDKYVAIVAIDASGVVRGSNTHEGDDGEEVSLEGCRLAGDWLDEVGRAQAGQTVWIAPTEPRCLRRFTDEPVVGYALPVFDILDDRLGAIAFFVSAGHVRGILDGYVTRRDGQVGSLALVLDSDGRVAVAPTGLAETTLARGRFDDEVLGGGVIHAEGGESYRVLGAALEGAGEDAGWSVLLLTHQSSFEAPIEALSRSLLWLFSIAVIAVVAALGLAGARLLRPIRRLTDAVGRTTRAADFRALPVETTDEVGTLTRTFNSIFGTLKEYEGSLEQKVEERTKQLREAKQEVSDILDNMAQAIFTVGAGRKVNEEHSAFCKELLGEVKIGGADVLDLLRIGTDEQAGTSLRFWLDTVVGADELQWALAGGTGPLKEVVYTRPDGGERVLQLEYAPIYADGLVAKVMFIARDMTTVVRLREEVMRKEDENRENIERVAELAQLDPELFTKFLAEADEIVEKCRESLGTLRDKPGDRSAIDASFRAMHTLKANARIFKMTSVQNVAHDAEDRFQKVRDGGAALDATALDELDAQLGLVRQRLDEYDRLGRRVLLGHGGGVREALQRTHEPIEALGRAARQLGELVLAVDEGADRAALDRTLDETKELTSRLVTLGMAQLAARAVETLELTRKDPRAGMESAGALESRAREHVAFHGELAKLPDGNAFIEESEPLCKRAAETLAAAKGGGDALNRLVGAIHSLQAHARTSGIRSIDAVAGEMEADLAALRDAGKGVADADQRAAAGKLGRVLAMLGDAKQILDAAAPKDELRRRGAMVRVPTARVMEVRRQVKELARALDANLPEGDVKRAYDSLDAAVRELTVVPLSDLFDRMTKVVLDLAIDVGKPTNDLVVEGGDIQVDTKLVDKMRDVLTHALRNAVDHGVEARGERPPEKPRRATIAVRAVWKGEDLVVSVDDDGRGVDFERVRATAVASRRLSEDDAARAGEEQLVELLFAPGFSTAHRVTELSGRGVGLDVIRTTMRELKGDASMTSTRGRGTTLTLRIPAGYYQQL